MIYRDCSELTVEEFERRRQEVFNALVKKHRRTWTRESSDYQGKPPRRVCHNGKVYDTPEQAAIAVGVTSNCIYAWCKMQLNGWKRL